MVSAVVMPAPDAPVELRALPRPTLGEGEVLLRTVASEVCGTDVHLQHGRLSGVPYPIVPGHVSVGEIAELGPGEPARDVDGRALQVGRLVTFLDVFGTCGRCWFCTVGQATTRCPHRQVYGITMSADDGLYGGWAEYIHLRAGVAILPLPAAVSWREFMAGGCGLPTAFHAVTRAEITMGDTVVVQGAGPVGLCAIALAQLRGAGTVIAIDASPRRRAAAARFGADTVLDVAASTADERVAAVRELTGGRGADVTIEATGVPAAVPEGMHLTRDAGRYVIVGQYTDGGDTAINPHRDINRPHLDVRGCWGSDVGHLWRSLRVLERYRTLFPWAELITDEFPLAEADRALRAVAGGEAVKALIVPV